MRPAGRPVPLRCRSPIVPGVGLDAALYQGKREIRGERRPDTIAGNKNPERTQPGRASLFRRRTAD